MQLPGPLGGPGGGGPPALPMGAGGGPPGGTGGAMVPQIMGASNRQGEDAARNAYTILMKALPNLPMGSDLWSAVHKAIGEIGKHLNLGQENNVQQLISAARDARTDPRRAAMMQAMPTPGMGGGPPPGMPPPGGGGGGPLAGLFGPPVQ